MQTNEMTDALFRKNIKEGMSGGFFFFGDEDYMKSHTLKTLKKSVCPDKTLEPFNFVPLAAVDLSPDKLLSALATFPMMADVKMVEIADFVPKDLKKSEFDAYIEAFSSLSDYDYNLLVVSIPAGSIEKGSEIFNKLAKVLTPVAFDKATPAMLEKWVGRHFQANGVTVDLPFCKKFVDYCGQDMFTLATEVDKLSYFALSNGRNTVTEADMKSVSIVDASYGAFDFSNALLASRRPAALKILEEMKRKKLEPTYVMSTISSTFCEMLTYKTLSDEGFALPEIASKTGKSPYRVRLYLEAATDKRRIERAIKLCIEADKALKSSQSGYAAIERFICSF